MLSRRRCIYFGLPWKSKLGMLMKTGNPVLFLWQMVFEFTFFCNFHQGSYIKITTDKINSWICLMLIVYKSFHQTFKYGHQRNLMLQDLTGLKLKFLLILVKPKT